MKDETALVATYQREETMRAVGQDRYGPPDVLDLREVEVPTPGAHDVLVHVRAASANPYDLHFMRGLPYIVRAGARRASDCADRGCPSAAGMLPAQSRRSVGW